MPNPKVISIFLLCASAAFAVTNTDVVSRAREFYRSQPRYLQPVLGDARVVGLSDVRAASCGTCHAEIYGEWRVSTHARAFLDDSQFQEELKKHQGGDGKQDAAWMCINCHTPFEAQLEKLVVGLTDGHRGKPQYVANPNFDRRMQEEAITCATCHVRDGVVVGPFGDTRAPHPVKKDPALLSSEVCLQCHQANATLDDVALACVFDTGLEHASTEPSKKGETCQSCHMPEVHRALSNFPPTLPRMGRRHFFGGCLIPKKPEFESDMKRMRAFYVDGFTVEWKDPPKQFAPATKSTVRFVIKNAKAGHMLPTGDPERFILVDAKVKTANGEILASKLERIGTVYEWNPVKKISDNRLKPGEERVIEFEFNAPEEGDLTLELVSSKYRISDENFKYHSLEGRYVAGIPVATARIEVPVRGE